MTSNTNSLSVLGILVQAALVIAILASLLTLILPISMMTASVNYSLGATIGMFGLAATVAALAIGLAGLACIVLIPIWTWRAQANLWAANLSGLTIGAGWAAAAWFVPVANLFVPLAAMKQLYNRSMGESEYQQADGIGMVTSWWAFALAWLFVFMVMLIMAFFPLILPGAFVTMPAMGEAGLVFFAAILQIGASVYLFRIVAAVTRAQAAGRHLGQASTFA